MPLTIPAIESARPRADGKPRRLYDTEGLYLEIAKSGGKHWRLKYRVRVGQGRIEKRLSLGAYPAVSLKRAREKRAEARRLLSEGIDPGLHRQSDLTAKSHSFKSVAHEWHGKKLSNWVPGHASKLLGRLDGYLIPYLGNRPIGEIEPPELLSVLQRLESAGKLETARRCMHVASQVFRYAVQTGRAKRDPAQDLKGALATPKTKHMAAVTTPKELSGLLRQLDDYDGSLIVRVALQLAALLFVRPGELRQARWAEFEFDRSEWWIPPERMKMRQPLIVPLAPQAVRWLEEVRRLTGDGEFVFPSALSTKRPMSENAVNGALRRLGIPRETMTGHGFRATARTLLDEELRYPVEWIEAQLGHDVRDANGRSYNRTAHIDGRTEMMRAWADYLDRLRAGDLRPRRYSVVSVEARAA